MGLFGHQNGVVRPEAKWDYIQLNDFKADGVLTYIAYGYLFVSLTISMAVYTVDTFTAVNLLAFNTWSSEIQPAIPFAITKWIFSVCIILSFVNVAYEHIRAQMIIRRGSVAESFLDNLAVRLQSVRILNGKGWRRFLVFAELTKSKKGAEYIALFTYFSFQAWIRIIFCSGPRQVVNAVTLYSVYTAKLEIDGTNFESSLESLFSKIKALAQQDYQQALILSGMLFTLIIWVFSALSFILACIFYVTFLWGWIPKQDGGLSGYCERKINKRLMSIVSKKVEAALADLEKQRKKAEMKAAKKAGALPPEERKATLPTLMPEKDDKTSDMPPLFRNDTVATLPVYTSRPGTPRGDQFELNNLPPMPTRTNTSITTSSRAPLLGASADMGVSTPTMPSPMYGPARSGTMNTARGPYAPGGPNRTMTGTSNYSGTMVPSGPKRSMTGNSNFSGSTMGPPQLSRIQTHDSSYSNASRGPQQLRRTQTANSGYSSSYGQAIYHSPDDDLPSMPAPVRSPTAVSNNYYGLPSRATPGPVSSYDDYYDRSTSAAPMSQIGARSEYGDYSSAGFPGAAPTRYMTPAPMYDEHAAGGRASPAPARQVNPRPTFNDFSATGRASPAPSKQMEPHLPFDDYASNGSTSTLSRPPTTEAMAVHIPKTTWHPGELAIHNLLHVHHDGGKTGNPTWAGLPGNLAYRIAISPLVALGALDAEGRPWTSVWGGEAGFAGPIGQGIVALKAVVSRLGDPVVDGLLGSGGGNRRGEGKEKGKKKGYGKEDEGYHITREDLESGRGKLMAGLSIDLATRDRVKIAGRLVASKMKQLDMDSDEESGQGLAEVQIAMLVEESLGNCPKYLNKRTIRPHRPAPRLIADTLPLPKEALELLDRADLFFLSTTDGKTMDTNHRGGPPGFVRVVSNNHDNNSSSSSSSSNGVTLIYPEYSGNRLYQSLGNLHVCPLVGICVPDFVTGDVLYLTGETKILVGNDAARVLSHTKLAVRIQVTGARFVAHGLSFRGDADGVGYSPYNPPVRRLTAEKMTMTAEEAMKGVQEEPGSSAVAIATLTAREVITPSISRLTFRLHRAQTSNTSTSNSKPLKRWLPGQHVTLDFSDELDMGWSHMRDDDPSSLNDDFVRTFTVSSSVLPPLPLSAIAGSLEDMGGDDTRIKKSAVGDGHDDGDLIEDGTEMQLTLRKHGPVTSMLWRWNLQAPLEVPVVGFGGGEDLWIDSSLPSGIDGRGTDGQKKKHMVFVAAGVGITPMLAQAPGLLSRKADFTLLWTLRAQDVAFAVDVWNKLPGLVAKMRLFITGSGGDEALIQRIDDDSGAQVIRGRVTRDELLRASKTGAGERKVKYLLCTGPEMLSVLMGWLEGEDVVYESFAY
ncbi:hypothetical protein BD289DRAFT_450954 [Coniella lustricola]|uniref:FAD-binding FR-type domain-containing protein n=1 Tax=Coniella lustricola TaxID=2025994 RepID=A0A2T3AH11_9PEZI|nr:hypothetical protein BD289DRAFT_450954 [Coniella lustricola]